MIYVIVLLLLGGCFVLEIVMMNRMNRFFRDYDFVPKDSYELDVETFFQVDHPPDVEDDDPKEEDPDIKKRREERRSFFS